MDLGFVNFNSFLRLSHYRLSGDVSRVDTDASERVLTSPTSIDTNDTKVKSSPTTNHQSAKTQNRLKLQSIVHTRYDDADKR